MARGLVIDSTTQHADTSKSQLIDEERQRIENIYQDKLTFNDVKEFKIEGPFVSEMPADVGGAGSHRYSESPMGSVGYDSERFRGDLDLAEMMQDVEDNIDEVVDLLVQWAAMTFVDVEEGYRLKEWTDGKLPHDFKDGMLLAWSHRAAVDLDRVACGNAVEEKRVGRFA